METGESCKVVVIVFENTTLFKHLCGERGGALLVFTGEQFLNIGVRIKLIVRRIIFQKDGGSKSKTTCTCSVLYVLFS